MSLALPEMVIPPVRDGQMGWNGRLRIEGLEIQEAGAYAYQLADRVPLTDSDVGSVSQFPQLEDSKPEDHLPVEVELDAPRAENFPLAGIGTFAAQLCVPPFQPINPQPASPASSDIQPYDFNLDNLDPQLRHLSLNSVKPYDPYRRLDSLTNLTLLSMFQAWQDVIDNGGVKQALEHPRFHDLLAELVERGIMSINLMWTVDVEGLDMTFSRKTGKGWES